MIPPAGARRARKAPVLLAGLLIAGAGLGAPHASSAVDTFPRSIAVSKSVGLTAASKTFDRIATQQSQATFLGFRPGEELRYALEGPEGQPPDRTVQWSIALLEVSDDGAVGTFELTYIVAAARQRLAQGFAEARINAQGFPLRVRFGSQRSTPLGEIGYTIEYRLEDGALAKELLDAGLEVQEIDIDELPGVTLAPPRGLYLYNPLDAACAAAFTTAVPPDTETPTSGGPGQIEIEELCGGRELIFANPGLLDLTMPALWETGTGRLDFVALAPTGVRLDLFTGPPAPGGGMSVGGMNLLGFLSSGPNPFHDGDAAFQPFGLVAGSDPQQLEVGGRPVDAWQLATPAPFAAVHVDGDGSIVRLDLPPDAAIEGGTWIRRLRPSEY